jgi:hypothetical protein
MLTAYRDGPCYEMTCVAGHTSLMILGNQKFDILFQIAGNAIVDGYYREAVVTFTSSLERLQEFAVQCLLSNAEVPNDTAEAAQKIVARQSERQLGAFIFLWLNRFFALPPLLLSADYGFRNEVVHNGKIPTREETLNYGNKILRIIQSSMRVLNRRLSEAVLNVSYRNIATAVEKSGLGSAGVNMADGTILKHAEAADDTIQLEEYLPMLVDVQTLLASVAEQFPQSAN